LAANAAQGVPPSAKDLVNHPNAPRGGLFNLPGVTYWSEQIENNDQIATVLAQGTQTVVQFPANLTNTDILYREVVEFNITNTVTLGTGGVLNKTSEYFPYNFLGPISLSMQNQFNTFDVPNGIDAKIFELIRPQFSNTQASNYWETNPVTDPYSAQANQQSAANYTSASTAIKFNLDIPMGVWFDKYFDLGPDGQLRGNLGPSRAFVTPQLMSGSNRIVTPRMTFNPASSPSVDGSPYNITFGTGGSFAGSNIMGWQRKIVYQPRGDADTPILWGWQYSRETKQYSLSGRSTIDIPLPITGQLLMLYYRFFDPSSGSWGAVIPIANIKNLWLQYGSGLYKFQDTPLRAQRRFRRQHYNVDLPEGVLCHDMVVDEQGLSSNQNVLNTLDTSSCKIHLDFTAAQSATAYVAIGVEALRFVLQQ
jgi:hypothetical protein